MNVLAGATEHKRLTCASALLIACAHDELLVQCAFACTVLGLCDACAEWPPLPERGGPAHARLAADEAGSAAQDVLRRAQADESGQRQLREVVQRLLCAVES